MVFIRGAASSASGAANGHAEEITNSRSRDGPRSAWLTVDAPPATSTPVPTSTVTATTSQPTTPPTTATPVVVTTRKATKRVGGLAFRFAVLRHHVSWAGTTNRIALEAHQHEKIGVMLTLLMPHNHRTFHGHTNRGGYWERAFHVPKFRNQRYPFTVRVRLELRKGKVSAWRTIFFKVVA